MCVLYTMKKCVIFLLRMQQKASSGFAPNLLKIFKGRSLNVLCKFLLMLTVPRDTFRLLQFCYKFLEQTPPHLVDCSTRLQRDRKRMSISHVNDNVSSSLNTFKGRLDKYWGHHCYSLDPSVFGQRQPVNSQQVTLA